ncbi:MAG TPA: DinB family protein, partial [Flavobacteriales bacterium]|nr:DinB family protein [Flavobacteriales bacterium]
LQQHIAKHFRDVHFGGNWTTVNVKDALAGVTWQQSITKVHDLNTIATLLFHVNYFVAAALQVLKGGPLDAHDKYSFDHPPISSQADWQRMVDKALDEAEQFAALVEQLPEEKLWADFTDPKYGTYYRNIHGIIEHTHYHLGQIVVIKKMLAQAGS